MEEQGMKRLATLVGCNYAGTRNELHGCINDVLAMRCTLVELFGFDTRDITVLTDDPGSTTKPTGANIKLALGAMIDRAEPGDVLFFHYSGHGTTVPAVTPHCGPKRDEAIVPCDFNLITDVDFRKLVNRLPTGSTLTIVSDSCHSGGLIDQEKEQIGPTAAPAHRRTTRSHRPKAISFDTVLSELSTLSCIDSPDVADHLSTLFGANASLKYRGIHRRKPAEADNGILLSGCQANETSADMCIGGDVSGAYGAFSSAMEKVLRGEGGIGLSNRELVRRVREVLHRQGFAQHPCLYCSDGNAEALFLRQSAAIAAERPQLQLQSSISERASSAVHNDHGSDLYPV